MVKEICGRAAVMEDGHVVEEGEHRGASSPALQAEVTQQLHRRFICNAERIDELIEEGHALTKLGEDEVIDLAEI